MAAERALVIKAKGGLGNRMLSAVTGIVLARLNRRTPVIDWRDGMYVAPGENLYPLLFEADWMGDADRYDAAVDVAPALWSGALASHPVDIIRRTYRRQHRDPLLYRKLSIDMLAADPAQRVGVFWSYLPKLMRLRRRLAASPAFRSRSLDAIASDILDSHFRPVPEVQRQVDAVLGPLAQPVIGVHIRFTDRKVPLARILAELGALKRRLPGASIFLATDSGAAQQAILSRYPDARTISKALSGDETALHFSSGGFVDPVAEARNALVDMIALSRCDWLVHSRRSTFSVAAALIGRIPEARQVNVERRNLPLLAKQFVQARL